MIASVGGVPVAGDVTAGSNVRIDADAFDPDDQVGTSPPKNICKYSWKVTDPENVISTSSGTNSYTTRTLNKAGGYLFELEVTDNEGQTSTSSITLVVSPERECTESGEKDCSDGKVSMSQGLLCGNISATSKDPTATRGTPLRNEITVNTRKFLPPVERWMGNGYFTYGISVITLTDKFGGTPLNPVRVLVDGFGKHINYGTSSSGSNSKTAGTYPTLNETLSGYTLSGAGAPEQIGKAGNFEYEFDTTGRLLSITDSNGNIQELTYDINGRPTLIEDVSSGKTIEFEYPVGSNTLINKVIENQGFAYREIAYDLNDNITSIITKNSSNQVVRTLEYTYDLQGRLDEIIKDSDSANKSVISYQPDGYGDYVANVTTAGVSTNTNYFEPVTAGASYTTKVANDKSGSVYYNYDNNGNLISKKEPAYHGSSTQPTKTYTYDSNKNILTEADGLVTYTYTYNSLGLVTKKEDTLGRYTQYTYNGVNLTSIADNLGTIATFGYTDTALPNAITEFTDGASNTWTIQRNSFGQVTEITPPSGSPTGALTFEYEENTASANYGWLKSITNGAGDVVNFDSYTPLGDATSITTNPSSGVTRTTEYEYDATQRETKVTHDDGKTVQTEYTGANPTKVTDEAGTETNYSYCAGCGKLTGISGPMSWALSWILDDDKDVTSFIDALSNATSYEYGNAREIKKITYPDSQYQEFRYTGSGRLWKYVRRNSTAALSYDASGNITTDYYYNYTYDNANQLLTATGTSQAPGSTVTYTYTNNRLISTISYDFSGAGLTNVQTVEYTYNPDQTVDTLTWKDGSSTVASWEYTYDAAGRVTSIENSFSEITDFTYDGEGKLLAQDNHNGTSKEYTYNTQRSWPTKITHKAGSTVTSEYTLSYDGTNNTVGNITAISELSEATVSYTYDSLYRLTGEARSASPSYSRTYGYDLAGNVTTVNSSSFASYDSANKVSTVLSKAVTHDIDGTLKTIAATSPFAFKDITWNPLQKATRIYRTSGPWADYRYMYDGKRYYSRDSSPVKTKYYIFAGDTLIGEITSQTPTAAYTWGADGLVSRRNLSGSTSFWYEFGPQGETRSITNGLAAVTDTYNYNAYGELIASTGSTENPFRYKGKYGYYTDTFVGLILATQRWYSPQMMRWMSRDPIGYEGGVNLYEYVEGDPINKSDPYGLDYWIEGPSGSEPPGHKSFHLGNPKGKNTGISLGFPGGAYVDKENGGNIQRFRKTTESQDRKIRNYLRRRFKMDREREAWKLSNTCRDYSENKFDDISRRFGGRESKPPYRPAPTRNGDVGWGAFDWMFN